MTVNNKILAEDYNRIQRRVSDILGVGTQNRGYGQTVRSSQVSTSTRVGTTEWLNLYYDITSIFRKQNATTPTATQLPLLTSDDVIRSDADATTFRATRSGNNLIVTEVTSGQLAIGQAVTGTGVTAGTVITGVAATQTPITISSFGSKTGSGLGPFTVVLNFAAQDRAPTPNVFYTVAGNSNPRYNGSYRCTASTTTTITLTYDTDPGTYGTGATTITITNFPNPYGRTTWTTNNSQTLAATTMTANRAATYPITAYETLSTSLDQLGNRFLLPTGNFFLVNHGTAATTWPGEYGDTWSSLIQCTVTVTFTTAARARAFFNSGGIIRFLAAQTGGSDVVPGTTLPSGAGFTNVPQNTSWRNLLVSAGTRVFGGNTPTQDLGTTNGQNYFRLTDVYQNWYSISGTTPYASNNYVIQARSRSVPDNSNGTARIIDFRIRWEDFHQGTGSPTAGPDVVNGTFTLAVSSHVPSGSLDPSGVFTIETPTVTIGAILEPSPN